MRKVIIFWQPFTILLHVVLHQLPLASANGKMLVIVLALAPFTTGYVAKADTLIFN